MAKTRVLYNDTCPICSREVAHYAKIATREDLDIAFDPLTSDAEKWGFDCDRAARQLHVQQGDKMLGGAEAFIALWSEIPRYRWLARLCALPVVRPVVGVIYDKIAGPALFRMHKRRQAS